MPSEPPVYLVVYSAKVTRRLCEEEVAAMRDQPDVRAVTLYDQPSHFYPECLGVHRYALARSLTDTTCQACLGRRAAQIRGWRWDDELNRADREYIESQARDHGWWDRLQEIVSDGGDDE